MTSINRLFKLALNVKNARVANVRIEAGRNGLDKVIVEVKAYKKDSRRGPICGRKCVFDTLKLPKMIFRNSII